MNPQQKGFFRFNQIHTTCHSLAKEAKEKYKLNDEINSTLFYTCVFKLLEPPENTSCVPIDLFEQKTKEEEKKETFHLFKLNDKFSIEKWRQNRLLALRNCVNQENQNFMDFTKKFVETRHFLYYTGSLIRLFPNVVKKMKEIPMSYDEKDGPDEAFRKIDKLIDSYDNKLRSDLTKCLEENKSKIKSLGSALEYCDRTVNTTLFITPLLYCNDLFKNCVKLNHGQNSTLDDLSTMDSYTCGLRDEQLLDCVTRTQIYFSSNLMKLGNL
ncbi:hypothetical protein ABK040_004703 [Willaertia magna]